MITAELKRYTKPLKVLDKGHVRLVDVMGDDTAVVQAARVSYGLGASEHKYVPDKAGELDCSVCGITIATGDPQDGHCIEGDRRLIRYLLSHRHTTPLEMCEIKLHVRVPMDAWRQWIRHRTASVNEYSTRYSEVNLLDDDGHIIGLAQTRPDEWRLQSVSSKQGSDGTLSAAYGVHLTKAEESLHRSMIDTYRNRLQQGVAKELARKDLPLSTYTEAYWKIDLHNLLHFLTLRLDKHAQLEIRLFAEEIAKIVRTWVPLVWEAFEDYRLNAAGFSSMEMEVLRDILDIHVGEYPGGTGGFLKEYKPVLIKAGLTARERKAFWTKLGVLDG